MNTFNFLLKSNDNYKLVTDREVEKSILYRVSQPNIVNSPINKYPDSRNTDLFIRIMELSKQIQVKYLEEYIKTKKIGYFGTNASFSYEVISKNFNCEHVSVNTLDNKIIDYALIPTYNSLIGVIDEIDSKYTILGSIDHKIELSLYANNKNINLTTVTLYIEETVFKEAREYINKKLNKTNIVITNTTEEGCIKCIQDKNSITIASKSNNCNFLHLLEDNIVAHNITTFTLIKI
jgi:hypothetical protein